MERTLKGVKFTFDDARNTFVENRTYSDETIERQDITSPARRFKAILREEGVHLQL